MTSVMVLIDGSAVDLADLLYLSPIDYGYNGGPYWCFTLHFKGMNKQQLVYCRDEEAIKSEHASIISKWSRLKEIHG